MLHEGNHTRRLVYTAILGAIAFLLMYLQVPLIPAANFLMVDFSILPVMVALMLFDLKTAFGVLLIRTVLKLFLNNGGISTIIGLPMNLVVLGLFVTFMALIWKPKKTLKSFLLASLLASLAMTASMVFLNYVYAIPLYAKFANFDINAIIGVGNYLMLMVIPFNLLEGLLFALAFGGIFWGLQPILKKV